MTVTLTYATDLGRIRIAATLLGASATHAVVDRSLNGVTWTTVRGGTAVPVATQELALPIDDYEFIDAQLSTYRVRSYNVSEVLQSTQTGTITPALETVWLKFIARPYLNRPVTVTDWSDVERASRNGVFPVIGRRDPVAITELHTSRSFTVSLLTQTIAQADSLDFSIGAGFPVYLHTPAGCGIPTVYGVAGNLVQKRIATRSLRRVFDLPLTEVAAPGPEVVGSPGSYQTLLSHDATYQAVIDEFATYSDVAELIGSPTDIIVDG